MKQISPHTAKFLRICPGKWLIALLFLLLICGVSNSLSAGQILISPPGGKYATPQRVVLQWDDPWEFRELTYSLDGREPDENSPVVLTPIAIDISATANLKVRAWQGSETASASFIIGPEIVEFTPADGTYTEGTAITLTAPYASNPVIHYTLDGSTPSTASPVYSSPLILQSGMQIKAFVLLPEKGAGVVQSASYSVSTTPVTFDPPSGEVLLGTKVALTSSPEATIYYVLNPTQTQLLFYTLPWVQYDAPIQIDADTVIYAKSVKSGQKETTTHTTYSVARLPRPEFIPAHGPISADTAVTITSTFSGAVIRYTLDGSEPSEDSPVYSTPVIVGVNGRLKARAFYPQYAKSFIRYTYFRSAEKKATPPPSADAPRLKFTQVSYSDRAIWITHAGDGSGRLFFVQSNGTVAILGQASAFLALTAEPAIPFFNEPPPAVEILSVAFPPDYDVKAYFYCSYRVSGGVRVSKFSTLADPNIADARSEIVIGNYAVIGDAGQLVFGPDGTLYLNRVGAIASHMPASFFGDSTVLSDKLIKVLVESGGEAPVEAVSGSWPYRSYLESVTTATVAALPYNGPFRRMQGRNFCADRRGYVYTLNESDAGVVSESLARPSFLDPLYSGVGLGEPPPHYPFDIAALGEDEFGRMYVSNYGKAYYYQVGGGPEVQAAFLGGGIYRVDDDETVFNLYVKNDPDGYANLSWQTMTGVTYQLQKSDDLLVWEDYLDPISGTGSDLQRKDTGSLPAQQRYYRVKLNLGE